MAAYHDELTRLGNRTLNFVALQQQHNALVCHCSPLHCFVCDTCSLIRYWV